MNTPILQTNSADFANNVEEGGSQEMPTSIVWTSYEEAPSEEKEERISKGEKKRSDGGPDPVAGLSKRALGGPRKKKFAK